jgi:hypothetical protein
MPGGIEPHSRPPRLKTPVTSSPAHKKRVELEYHSAEPPKARRNPTEVDPFQKQFRVNCL